ncbi:hypothetical protein GOBAR_DD14803 [Gossypium barbadense]|nr:hypothetical protein GOBAR_DD14803 [Gossypium barbadense]
MEADMWGVDDGLSLAWNLGATRIILDWEAIVLADGMADLLKRTQVGSWLSNLLRTTSCNLWLVASR